MDQKTLQSICIPPSTTLKQAIVRLNETARRLLLVIDTTERLLATISDGDIRRGILKGHAFDASIEPIMYRDYTAFHYTDPESRTRAKAMMREHNLTAIPLIDQHERVRDVIHWTDIFGSEKKATEQHAHDNTVVIMAGGKGTRLDVFTKIFPKPLIPVGDKAAIEVIMNRFARDGFQNFLYTLNYKKEYVKLFLKEKKFPPGHSVDWVEEEEFLGTAGSLSLLHDKVHETFFVVNCDTLLDVDCSEILAWHHEHGAPLTVVGCHNEVDVPFGVIDLANGKLERIRERPTYDTIINTGMYVMEPRVLEYLEPNTPLDMNELINRIAEKEEVNVYPVYGKDWLDLGQWDRYSRSIDCLKRNGDV